MALLLSFAFTAVLLSTQVLAAASIDNKTFEYIVVGSGPGGGPIASNLARAGRSVLLIEAGYVIRILDNRLS
jgi:choline dehydrogenase